MIIRTLIENTACSEELHHEHGLSLYIEVQGKRILFDAGQTTLFSENAEAMGVDLSKVDLAILSHGHYDHSGGLKRFLEINDHAPVYMNRRAFGQYWSGEDHYIGIDQALKENGRIILTDDETYISDAMRLVTCNDREARFPLSGQGLTARSEDGCFMQDRFLHEQYLEITEAGRRILISGCSHKGILNIMNWMSPDVLVGGFHFMKMDVEADQEALRQAARALMEYPAEYYTGHCTGQEQYVFLKKIMGDRLHALPAGSTIEIS